MSRILLNLLKFLLCFFNKINLERKSYYDCKRFNCCTQTTGGDSEVRFVYNTAQPMWAKSIGVGGIAEQDGVVYVIEDDWNVPEWIPEGLIEE